MYFTRRSVRFSQYT
jgi:hypothetical protein